jgi:transcriptional regulator with XRE-family HTH domain
MPEEEAPGVIAQLKTAIQNWQQRGGTLNQLARRAKIDSGTVVRFVNGERSLTLPTVEKICRALNLDLTQSSDPFADETRPPEGQAT